MAERRDPESLAELVDRIVASQAGIARPIVLIDGGSGSGKSTLAVPVAERLGAHLIRLDDLYPGWDGLEAASTVVTDSLLTDTPRWQRWDWKEDRPAGSVEVDPTLPLVIEGSGSLSRAARHLATFGVWLELAEPERHRRAIARDGDAYEPYWDRWAAQEATFFARERPDLTADLVVDASRIPI
ncbi:MAG TPA: ATP-binding protein [Pseudolysinimonas sp.]|nr:ATP-binding protein [Pseudolysinimonas sp.]